METLREFFLAYPVLSLAQTAFMVWMLVDAGRRRADYYWFWIILTGVGAWAYFFAIKVHDFRGTHLASAGLGSLFQRRPSLDELRYRAEHTPTLVNHLNLAHRLIERKQYSEALPHLQAALKTEPEHGMALYSLALCHKEMGNPERAQPVLEDLLSREPRWSNDIAWHLLIDVRTQAGNSAGAVEACRQLVRLAPTLEHHCLLAEHLLAGGQAEEARNLLERALRDHDFAPRPIRRRNRRWASEARRLLKQAAGLSRPVSR